MKHRRITKIILLIVFLFFCSFFRGTKAIYRETLGENVTLNILDSSTSYVVTFDSMGGTSVPSVTRSYNQPIGPLSEPYKAGFNFDGWYTAPNGGGTKIDSTTLVRSTITYYAYYNPQICKIASSLHEEVGTKTVTYGTIVDSNTLVPGNAYDCDVNGDGQFNVSEERFYYLADDEDDNAIFIYSNNTSGGLPVCGAAAIPYNQSGNNNTVLNYLGPITSMESLPSTTQWSNVSLHNQPRQITNQLGGTTTTGGNIVSFTYTNKAARYATVQEIEDACDITVSNSGTTKFNFNTCGFLLENTSYNISSCRSNYWLETPIDNNSTSVYRVAKDNDGVVGFSAKNSGVRPVIEVPYKNVQLYDSTIRSFTISFDSMGGSSVPSVSRSVSETVGPLNVPTKNGYIFQGWYTDTNYTTPVTRSTVVNSDVTYYAKWLLQDSNFPYVFYVPGECIFSSNDVSDGGNGSCVSTLNPTNQSIDYTTLSNRYIDTGIALYDTTNHDLDYEIGFTIGNDYLPSNQVENGTLMNTKSEDDSIYFPGVVFRRKGTTNNFLIQSRNTTALNSEYETDYSGVSTVKIYRIGDEISYSINGGTKTILNDLSQYNPVFDLTTWFAAAPTDATATSARRYFIGTLSNLYIRVGTYPVGSATVTWDADGGTASFNTTTVSPGSQVGQLPTAEKTGFTFGGWFTDNTYTTEVTTATTVSANVTFIAKWIPNVTATFDADGGTASFNSKTVTSGSQIGALPTAEKTGFTFGGWFTDNTYTTQVTTATIVSANVTFIAKWIPDVTATFDADGGTASFNSKTVSVGSQIGELPIAEKSGFAFGGWFTDNTYTTQVTTSTVVSANVTFIAKWDEITYFVVTFDSDGGSSVPPKNVDSGEEIGALTKPTKSNYNFLGWYTDTTYTTEVTPSTVVTGNMTVYAKWVDSSYVACIGTTCFTTVPLAVNSIDVSDQTEIKVIKNCTNPGGSDVTLNRLNVSSSRNIILNLNGYTLTANSSSPGISNDGTMIVKDGTILSSASQGVINNNLGATMIVDSVTVTASGSKQGIYNKGDLTIRGDSNISASSGNRAAVHNDAAAGSIVIESGTITSSNFSAVLINSGTLTIGVEDRTHDITTPVFQGSEFGLNMLGGSASFYDGIIKGESDAVNGGSRISQFEDNTTDATGTDGSYTTYYRVPYNAYTVTLDVDGGTGVPASILVDQNGYVGVLPTPTKNNHIFDGWYQDSGFNTPVETTTVVSGNTTFYAKWIESISYTVTFNAQGGTATFNTKTLANGSEIGALPLAERTGEVFLGWYTAASGGTKINEHTLVAANITYYAHFASTICKRASTLHSSGGTDYGQIPSGYELRAGDAFDCDVNGDGQFDASTERFYYLTDDDNDNAVLIYYNNTSSGSAVCDGTAAVYGSSYTEGPTTAYNQLPSELQWPNVSLSSIPRQIKNENGIAAVGLDSTSTFGYTDKAARFATVQEIKEATNSSINGTTNELNNYSFLLENVVGSSCNSSYWLETPSSVGGSAYIIDGSGKLLGTSNSTSAVRPVIEIPYSLIEVDTEPVEFDIIPTAMRTYFSNVDSWNYGQNDFNYSTFNNLMRTNLSNENCAYYLNNDVSTQYGSVFCDQPNKYDTGITDDINVYEYNEETREKSNSVADYVSVSNGKLYNMIPNKVYYWVSASDSTIYGYVKPIGERRLITINGTSRMTRNVRDLGGLPVDTDGDGTIDGNLKYQKIYRGEKIWDGAQPEFEKLGVYNEFDLRTPNSWEVVPSEEDQLIGYTSSEVIQYKIDFTEFGSAAPEPRFNGKSYYQLDREAVIDFMQRIVNGNDDYAVYFHCRIGADRTGTMAYILEGLLGVPTEYRYLDYELSTFFGLRERTRYYYEDCNGGFSCNRYQFIYLKNAIRNATPNNSTGVEDVMAWFLQGSSNVQSDRNLVEAFRAKMIDGYVPVVY